MYLALPHLRASQAVLVVKNLSVNAGDTRDMGLIPGSESSLEGRAWQTTPVFLTGESHGQRNLADCSLWGHKELDTTER